MVDDTELMLRFAYGLVASTGEVTVRHSETVAELALAVAEELGLEGLDRQELEAAALLHDVGKAEIPETILGKPGPLTAKECRVVETHTVLGEALLLRADPALWAVGRIVRSCHERWDGAGYPDGLSGEEIPLAARIVFCCDAYEAMTSDRPYRTSIGHARAVRELWACSGTQFDPDVVSALIRTFGASRLTLSGTDADPEATAPPAPFASVRAISG